MQKSISYEGLRYFNYQLDKNLNFQMLFVPSELDIPFPSNGQIKTKGRSKIFLKSVISYIFPIHLHEIFPHPVIFKKIKENCERNYGKIFLHLNWFKYLNKKYNILIKIKF